MFDVMGGMLVPRPGNLADVPAYHLRAIAEVEASRLTVRQLRMATGGRRSGLPLCDGASASPHIHDCWDAFALAAAMTAWPMVGRAQWGGAPTLKVSPEEVA